VRYAVSNNVVLSQTPVGPLAAYLEPFAKSLMDQGYTEHYIQRQVFLAACFSRWLRQTGVLLPRLWPEQPARYLQGRHRRRRPNPGDRAALDHLVDFLRREGVIVDPAESCQRSPMERCVGEYAQYLRDARGLAEVTIHNYTVDIRRFLKNCYGNDGAITLSRLCACDVVRFVQQQVPGLHRKRAKVLTTALRSFLRYVRFRGEIQLDLAAAVPVVPNWWMSSIPRGIAVDQVRKLLASVDRGTAIGRRDYAILLLLARMGLRSSEVVFLELDDIDWITGQLHVRGKGQRRTELPLPAEVGKAIVAYLRRGRPQSACRRVFLRAKAPVEGFRGPCGVGSIVRHHLKRTGIDAPTYGAHQFRHGLATQMLHRGSTLREIGELLGHSSPETTRIYTKVHLDALRRLALPWPGGVP
jgi:integrase/recombinase XerD